MTIKLLSMIGAAGIAMCTSSCVVPSGHVGGQGAYSASVGLSVLPYGYRTHSVGGISYFFHNNYWYTQRSGRYFRTGAPRGYTNYYRSNNNSRSSYNNNTNRRAYGGNSSNTRRTNSVNRNSNYRSNVISQSRQDLQSRTSRSTNTSNRSSTSSRGSNFNGSSGSSRRSR